MVAKYGVYHPWITVNKSALEAADQDQRRQRSRTVPAISPSPTKEHQLETRRKRKQELNDARDEINRLHGVVDSQKEALQESTSKFNEAEIALKTMKNELEDAKKVLLQYDAALKNSNTICRASLSVELVAATEKMIKTVLFQNWKFLEDEADLVAAAEKVYDLLKDNTNYKLDMTKAEYASKYKIVFQKALADARQYVQSECKKRAQGM
jgi:DNA repair exonuclease SbcCD ATPase subunit